MLALCLGATLWVWNSARADLEARARERLDRAAQGVAAALVARVHDFEDLARSAAGFYAGNPALGPAEFQRYVAQLDLMRREPAFVSLAFIEPVRREDVPAWTEARQREGTTLAGPRIGERETLDLIRLFESVPALESAVGVDAGANPVNRAVLDAARNAGEVRLSAPLPLKAFPSERGAALQAPVVVPGRDGRPEFRGWMSVLVRLEPLMGDLLRGADSDIAVALHDGSGSPTASPLYVTPGPAGGWPEPLTTPMTLSGHPFTLVFSPRPGFAASTGALRPRLALGAGLVASAFVFGIAWALSSTRRRAVGHAVEMDRVLRESERRYEVLFEQNLAGIYRSTEEGRILECNEAFARIFGYPSRREMLDDSAVSLYERPEERARFLEELRSKGTLLNHEQRYRRRDGTPVWTLEYVTRRAGAKPVIEGTIVDVSETKRAEEALRASEERYRGMFQRFRDGIFFFDPATKRVLETNPSLQKTLGYTAGEMRSLTLYDLVLDDPASIDANVERASAETVIHLGERQYRRKDGTRVDVDIEAFRFEESGRPLVFVLVRNLAEKQLLEDQLRQAQKMEAVGRLAGGVAHDFNNLLTAILGYSDMVLTGNPPEDIRQNVDEVRKAAERAASLTGQLLAFSRKQVLQPRILALNAVVKDVDAMLHRVLRENVKIVHEPDPHLWRVKADPGQIQQVLLNLTVNASDAMPDGGTLTIRTRNEVVGEGAVRSFQTLRAGPYVILEVSDTGHGMDADTLAHAFEPFFTTKERGKGTGLGLATVYGIVKQSGGFIEVESEPGKGATFRIYLPRVHGAADSPSNVSPRPTPIRGTETILLVEDEEAVRRLAQTVLRARGYRVLVADSAETALGIARDAKESIHLLLTDVVLPEMNGRQLAEVLAVERPGLAVLFTSGYFETETGVESEAFLHKPFTPEGLIEKVRATLGKSRGGPGREPLP